MNGRSIHIPGVSPERVACRSHASLRQVETPVRKGKSFSDGGGMPVVTAPLKIKKYETPNLRVVREEVANDNLRILWRRKGLITGFLISALLLALVALIVVGPRYTAAAIIEFRAGIGAR